MARPRIDPNNIAKRLAEGRGRGHGSAYRPWLDARSVPSSGLTSRIPGRTARRVHHVFSTVEADCCYLLDDNVNVVDIREQFPLLGPDDTLDETRQLAADLGVRHPTVPGTDTANVMTTDFVVTVLRPHGDAADLAIACKPASKLADRRTLEKLELERRYWAARDVAWGVVTERELPRATVESVRWIATVGRVDAVVPSERVDRLTDHLRDCLAAAPAAALADVCAAEDDRLGLRPGACLTLARHALATKRWVVDLSDGHTAVRPQLPLPPLRPYTTAHGVWCERAQGLVTPAAPEPAAPEPAAPEPAAPEPAAPAPSPLPSPEAPHLAPFSGTPESR